MLHVFMSLSVECKLKTWKTTIGKKKEIKAETQRCALSEKRNFSGPFEDNNSGGFDGETLFFFCIVTHSALRLSFPSTKKYDNERNGRKAMDKEDYVEKHAQAFKPTRELFSCLFWIDCDHFDWFARGVWAIAEITRDSNRCQSNKTSTKSYRSYRAKKNRGVKMRLQQLSSLLFLDQERRWRNF